MKSLLLIVALFVLSIVSVESAANRISLQDVSTLLFEQNVYTKARRTESIPQLSCVAGPCSDYPISSVVCTNQGFDGVDVIWSCTAQTVNHGTPVRLKQSTVICEGYNHADDPYVLAGSCALEYSLETTVSHNNNISSRSSEWLTAFVEVLFMLIGMGLIVLLMIAVFYLIDSFCTSQSTTTTRSASSNDSSASRSFQPPEPFNPQANQTHQASPSAPPMVYPTVHTVDTVPIVDTSSTVYEPVVQRPLRSRVTRSTVVVQEQVQQQPSTSHITIVQAPQPTSSKIVFIDNTTTTSKASDNQHIVEHKRSSPERTVQTVTGHARTKRR